MNKLNTLALALALGLGSLTAQAANVVNTIDLIGDVNAGWSAGLSDPSGTAVNHTVSGSFTDTFTFTFTGNGIIDVWLDTSVNKNALATQQIVFTSATLNGMPLVIDPSWTEGNTIFRTAGLFQVPASGELTLIVNGYAGLINSVGQQISASYSGGLNAIPTPVPEPESYALMLAGLGVVGMLAGRRRRRD